MKLRHKVSIGLAVGVTLLVSSLVTFIFLEDIIYDSEFYHNQDVKVKPKGKPIQQLAKVEEQEKESSSVSKTTMVSGGLSQEEADVLYALNLLWGDFSNAKVTEYLDLPKDEFRAETIKRLLPGVISESIKFGIRPGNSLAQAIKEHGWYKEDSKPKSWYFNNAYGIKVSGEPTAYWDGSTEVINTKEHQGGETISIKDDFRSYPSLWHSSMDHGLFLTKERYTKYNILEEKDPYKYGRKLGLAGYYTTDGTEGKEYYLDQYAQNLETLFNDHNFDRLDDLAKEVKEIVSRNSGTHLTSTGNELKEGEWKPQTKETYGYFINPKNVKLVEDASFINDNGTWKTHGAWDLKAIKESEVYTSKSGVVGSIIDNNGDNYGKTVVIAHSDNYFTRYSNLDTYTVKLGDQVSQGDKIGRIDRNKVLHFEVLKNGTTKKLHYVDPSEYFNGKKGESYRVKSNSSFEAYKRVLNSVGYYDGTTLDAETSEVSKVNLKSTISFVNNDVIEKVPNDVKPVYSPDNSWVSEFKVNLNNISDKRIKLLEEATMHLGKSYLWAANGPNKFDCSGYTRWVYRKALNVNLPRHSAHQIESSYMEKISLEEAKPGDLVFIPAGTKRSCNHIGIFIRDMDSKNIILMHAPRKNDRLKVYKYPKSNGLHFYRLKGIDY